MFVVVVVFWSDTWSSSVRLPGKFLRSLDMTVYCILLQDGTDIRSFSFLLFNDGGR